MNELRTALPGVVDFEANSSPQTPPPDVWLADLATKQHGVVSHVQLVGLGFSEAQIKRRIVTGRLHAVHRGVYAVGHRRLTRNGRWMAAVLACGPLAFLSHFDAALLWGVRRSSLARIHVTTLTPERGRGKQTGLVVHQPRSLHEDDRALVDGIPVTSIARTALDLSEVVNRRQLDRLIEEAERRELFDLARFDELLERTRGRKGKRLLAQALIDYRPGPDWTRSDLEDEFLRQLRLAELPAPAVNNWVAGYEVDCVWFEQRAIVELDGGGFHDTTAARQRDPQRDLALQLAGYVVMRVRDTRLERDPAGVMDDVRRMLSRPVLAASR
jgi:very-short-patch-repair endonuclease